MELRTFIYEQNNSGGSFIVNDNLRKIVFIEAESPEAANIKAQSIGIDFDEVFKGNDCKCCGNRWVRADYMESLETLNFNPFKYFIEYHPNIELGFLYKHNGEKIKIDIVDKKLILKKV